MPGTYIAPMVAKKATMAMMATERHAFSDRLGTCAEVRSARSNALTDWICNDFITSRFFSKAVVTYQNGCRYRC